MIKKLWSTGIVFLFLITLFASNIFACACCAERGHYSIKTSKPDKAVLDMLKNISFTSANLYTNAGYPDNIKGIKPLNKTFNIKSDFTGNSWKFDLTDDKSKSGKLELLKPISMIEYMVDLNPSDFEKPVEALYKEFRFKYKVNNANGIFKDGFDKNNEYFLVLQGSGNLCTNPEDFKNYRLEVTGKKANYMFFGAVGQNMESDSENDIKIAKLQGDYRGCSCSGVNKKNGSFYLFSELGNEEETIILNIDGKDKEFKLTEKGKRPEPDAEKVGDKFSDEYFVDGIKVIVGYTTKKLPCEECEGTDYDIVLTVITEYAGKVIELDGSCGC